MYKDSDKLAQCPRELLKYTAGPVSFLYAITAAVAGKGLTGTYIQLFKYYGGITT